MMNVNIKTHKILLKALRWLEQRVHPEEHPPRRSLQDQVIDDMAQRKAVGLRNYGTYLYPDNGRDMLLDAYEEALDLCCYLKGAIVERNSKLKR